MVILYALLAVFVVLPVSGYIYQHLHHRDRPWTAPSYKRTDWEKTEIEQQIDRTKPPWIG